MPRTTAPRYETMADVLDRLGGIDPRRVRLRPPPGKATEEDLLRLNQRGDRLYELVDGTLVEKIMGDSEGGVAIDLALLLSKFLDQHTVADLVGADSTMRVMPGLIRLPDLAVVRWERHPDRERPREAVPDLAPDLVVEMPNESNTPREMQRKLKEYFLAGVRLVWFVDQVKRTVEVFTSPDERTLLSEADILDGGDVLPGLQLPVRDVFARVPRTQAKPAKKRPRRRSG